MGAFLDTSGNARLTVAICGRCSLKFPIDELQPDVNSPGLLVCRYDADDLDPYRLPPRETEDITVTMPRPDLPVDAAAVIPGSTQWPASIFPASNGTGGSGQLPTTGNNS